MRTRNREQRIMAERRKMTEQRETYQEKDGGRSVRQEWVERMLQIAQPVLEHLSGGRLKECLPVDFHPDRKIFQPLEAFGRTMDGIAPWLELEGLEGKEKEQQEHFRVLARESLRCAVDPSSGDYMDFGDTDGQPLVDTAFLAHAIVRAPRQLCAELDGETREYLAAALKKSRRITPCPTNWLFFSAMVETALAVMGDEDFDCTRIDYAVRMFEEWYLGDGIYGDGPEFHWDYYNSFVIQPMYVDIIRKFGQEERYSGLRQKVEARASRHAQVLERMIGPDGTYPILGRSIAYRFGVFQLLGQAALEKFLPEELPAAQVRSALTQVLRRVMEAGDMFDGNGWLRPGVFGWQPELAEEYIGTGSLYLCTTVFLPLGLSPEDEFWSGEEMEWTSKKVWSGKHVMRDHAI